MDGESSSSFVKPYYTFQKSYPIMSPCWLTVILVSYFSLQIFCKFIEGRETRFLRILITKLVTGGLELVSPCWWHHIRGWIRNYNQALSALRSSACCKIHRILAFIHSQRAHPSLLTLKMKTVSYFFCFWSDCAAPGRGLGVWSYSQVQMSSGSGQDQRKVLQIDIIIEY